MQQVLTGIVLSAAAGLNAFIPILVLAIADRVSTSVELQRPFDIISTTAGILIILTLVTMELLLDKIPRVDALLDLFGYVVRPASGAFLFMAVTYKQDSIDVVVALVIGLLVAGGVHVFKARSRVKITAATNGVANPIISMIEDFVAATVSALAILVPFVGFLSAIVAGIMLYLAYERLPRMPFWAAKPLPGNPNSMEAATQPERH